MRDAIGQIAMGALVCCLFAAAADARAEDRDPPSEAVEYYERGRENYQSGRYRDAVRDLERALALDPGSPTLMYNLARTHELLGELDRSIDYYRRYLSVLPREAQEERARTEVTLRRLEGAQAHGVVEPPPGPHGAPTGIASSEPRFETRKGVADRAFWITAAASGALVATGTVLGVLALREKNNAEDFVLGEDGTAEAQEKRRDRAQRLGISADVSLFAGVGCGVAAVLLYALRERTIEHFPADDAPSARVNIHANGESLSVAVQGTF